MERLDTDLVNLVILLMLVRTHVRTVVLGRMFVLDSGRIMVCLVLVWKVHRRAAQEGV